jgi:acetyltransferase-like isoleucine patch superfamily enzyme
VTYEPKNADPAEVARRVAAAPALKLAPPAEWEVNENDELVHYKMQSMGYARKARNRLGELIFNSIVTHIPSHTVRQGFLRLCGATIGKGSTLMRGVTILDIEFLTIGENTTIGGRCLLDSRAGLYIGNNVTLANNVQLVGGGHNINDPYFLPIPGCPSLIQDYVWIATAAIVIAAFIRRGAVVAAGAVVIKEVGECEIVGGNPAKVIGKRDPEALKYSASYRPLFG